MSALSQAFSSKLLRGNYAEEKPLINFDYKGTEQEKRRLISMVNKIASHSETGRAVLQKAADAGYSMSFEIQSGCYGFANPEGKRLVMNPMFRDGDLMNTIVHESRHAGQFLDGVETDFGRLNLKSEIIEFRAMEADACAMATLAVLEAERNGLKQRGLRSEASPAVRQAFDEGKDNKEVLNLAFDKWYDDLPVKESYEDSYIIGHMRAALKHPQTMIDSTYDVPVSAKEAAELICTTSDGCYLQNPEKLETEKKFIDIAQGTKAVADKFFALRERATMRAPDESYKDLPVRQFPTMLHGNFAGMCYEVKKPAKNPVALLKAKAAQGR